MGQLIESFIECVQLSNYDFNLDRYNNNNKNNIAKLRML